jgi:parvulin-like peptidyl-prolyl isomerase
VKSINTNSGSNRYIPIKIPVNYSGELKRPKKSSLDHNSFNNNNPITKGRASRLKEKEEALAQSAIEYRYSDEELAFSPFLNSTDTSQQYHRNLFTVKQSINKDQSRQLLQDIQQKKTKLISLLDKNNLENTKDSKGIAYIDKIADEDLASIDEINQNYKAKFNSVKRYQEKKNQEFTLFSLKENILRAKDYRELIVSFKNLKAMAYVNLKLKIDETKFEQFMVENLNELFKLDISDALDFKNTEGINSRILVDDWAKNKYKMSLRLKTENLF